MSLDPHDNLEYSDLLSPLHAALEADLSSQGWPRNSKVVLSSVFEELEYLVILAEQK